MNMNINTEALLQVTFEVTESTPYDEYDYNFGTKERPVYKHGIGVIVADNENLEEETRIFLEQASDEQLLSWYKEYIKEHNTKWYESICNASKVKVIRTVEAKIETTVYL